MSIPVSDIVSVNPGVLGTGGSPLALNGVIMTKNTLLPTGEVMSFSSPDAVSLYFGSASDEAAISNTYFLGFDNSTIKPGTLYFAPYNNSARAAWLKSGAFTGSTLADLQSISGTFDVIVDGLEYGSLSTSGEINLSNASSYSNVATMIEDSLTAHLASASCTAGSVDTVTMTLTGAVTNTFKPGMIVSWSGVAGSPRIIEQVSGTTGGDGIYTLSSSSNTSSAVITATAPNLDVAWDSILDTFTITSGNTGVISTVAYATGTAADALKFTSSGGAILSQGAVADTPTTAMNNVKKNTQNWVDFMTIWEPDVDNKKLFAVWTNNQNQRYMYVAWDTDGQAVVNGSTTCFGAVAKSLAYDGVVSVYNNKDLAAFVLGSVASIDFSRLNGRITAAFKSQSGFVPTVTDQQIALNLLANGYSFYGKYATANDQFNFLYNGQMSGKWKWIDTFVDQVYLNSQLQLALISLLTSVKSVPYNESGYALIRAAMQDPIHQALNFGAIRTGVAMSESQKAQVNQAAGKEVTSYIEQQGYYLQILDPGAQVRGLRGTPVINFWFTDGGAVQKINIASIDIM